MLEDAVTRAGGAPEQLWDNPGDWSALGPVVDPWVASTGTYLAQAIISACSVIDFQSVIIDGNLPAPTRAALVATTAQALQTEDLQGIRPFELNAGSLGHNAQVLGGASLPLMARYLVDNAVLFKNAEAS